MIFPSFDWPAVDEFVNRTIELGRLDDWWDSPERMPLNVFGRRRVGKSWLLRRFANNKPALFLQARRTPGRGQLNPFLDQLTAFGGSTEPLEDVPSLFRRVYQIARSNRVLAVIDEFPWLLPEGEGDREVVLTGIQAVMEEERESSKLKLILCGSAVDQMQALQSERNPLYGRLIPLEIRPLARREAAPFLQGMGVEEALTCFAIAGGMPRYLNQIAGGSIEQAICDQVLGVTSPLWNEGRTIVEQELPEPELHMSILDRLAHNRQSQTDLAERLQLSEIELVRYLDGLEDVRLIRRNLPLGAPPNHPRPHWNLEDPFLRFWFRFVYPYQRDLEMGLAAQDLWTREIEPNLAHHVSPVFEEESRIHARTVYGHVATQIGRWWGNSLNELRQRGERSSEEIDIVGVNGRRVELVGEAKWTNSQMSASILREIREYKIPALRQDGFKVTDEPLVLLYSRSGFSNILHSAAVNDPRVVLVDSAEMFPSSAQ